MTRCSSRQYEVEPRLLQKSFPINSSTHRVLGVMPPLRPLSGLINDRLFQ
ncbi:MAG: hypothetical protein HC780_16945 [Leptolyngbyaceae cyanobacterium CSU_1_3]|nr:hypothetical protein [Leptolyngbyaceae cyanobacterium CSU_1_3]